jgi:phytoene dehydrogenase-like protein
VTPVAEKIIVVGAGLAGLTAARDMKVAGLDVTVLEAREHIGGRTYTDQSTGIPLEMGAHWILGINQSATYE